MILAKQRVIDLNKSLAVPLAERKANFDKQQRMYMRNKKQTKVLKQREEIIHNIN